MLKVTQLLVRVDSAIFKCPNIKIIHFQLGSLMYFLKPHPQHANTHTHTHTCTNVHTRTDTHTHCPFRHPYTYQQFCYSHDILDDLGSLQTLHPLEPLISSISPRVQTPCLSSPATEPPWCSVLMGPGSHCPPHLSCGPAWRAHFHPHPHFTGRDTEA